MSNNQNYAVRVVSKQVGGAVRAEAQFVCRCGAIWSKFITPGKPINPEDLAKRARADGWQADHRHASMTRCPNCLAEAAAERKGESPYTNGVHPPIMQNESAMPTITTPRELTPDERMRVRNLLDKHFDDGVGCYLDGMSDEKIASECNVPAARVAQIREAAYGPIRIDPEIATMKAELKLLGAEVQKMKERLDDVARRLDEVIAKKGSDQQNCPHHAE